MSKLLTKQIRTIFTPGSPGVASSPGSPARAAYTSYESRMVCAWSVAGSTYKWVLDSYGVYQRILVPARGVDRGELTNTTSYRCSTETVPVYHPAQPAVPPTPGIPPTAEQTAYDYNFGWNAGARSQLFVSGDGYVQFTALAGVSGAIAGLNDVNADAGYLNIEHAFYLTHGVARILESGIEKAWLGLYTSGATFRIDRRFGVVSYYIDDVLKYTSATPSVGTVFLDASLYAGGDSLDNPAVGDYNLGAAAVSFQPMQAFAAQGVSYAIGAVSFPPMTAAAFALANGSSAVSFLPMQAQAADHPYAASDVSFPEMTVSSLPGEFVPSYAVASSVFAPMSTEGLMLTGGIGGGAVSFPAMLTLSADHVYGASTVSFPPMVAYSESLSVPGEANIAALLLVSFDFDVSSGADVLFSSSIAISCDLVGESSAEVLFESHIGISDDFTTDTEVDVLFASAIQIRSFLILDALMTVWVLNANTAATTRYANFNFNSFAQIGGKHYGMLEDGIYELTGATDDGAAVAAAVNLGKNNFGTAALKSLDYCYIGAGSSGEMVLKVVADGETYFYTARSSSPELATHRIDLGRGLRSNYLELELQNADGDDFELANIEFTPIDLGRRI